MPYIAKTIQSNDKMIRSAYLGVLRKLDSIHKPVDKTTNNNCDRNDIIKPRSWESLRKVGSGRVISENEWHSCRNSDGLACSAFDS